MWHSSPRIKKTIHAAEADPLAAHVARVWQALADDGRQKTELIMRLERELAEILVNTP